MDRDKMAGKATQQKGKAREAMGRSTGNEKQQAMGKADQVKGKVQEKYGQAKEEIRKRT